MSWRDQPNASHFSARYAEQKRAAERALVARGPRPVKCSRSSCTTVITRDHLCPACRAESDRLRDAGDYAGADAFVLGGRP
jgi:hypothetical protein